MAEIVGKVVIAAGLLFGLIYGIRRFAMRSDWPGEIYDIEGEPDVA